MAPLEATGIARDRVQRPCPPSTSAATPFVGLLERLRALATDSETLAVGVIGGDRRTSVAATAISLASAAADSQGQTLLIDATGPRSRVAKTLRTTPGEGLADILYGHADSIACLRTTTCRSLAVLPWGTGRELPLRRSTAIRFSALVESYRGEFDSVIVPLPPASVDSPGVAMAEALDGVLLVVEAEQTAADVARQACRLLQQANIRVWGAVLNNCRDYLPAWLGAK